MELEGLKRSLTFLEDHGIAVELIVTDRHAQIKCFLRKEKQSIRHEFDVWHVAKGAYESVMLSYHYTFCILFAIEVRFRKVTPYSAAKVLCFYIYFCLRCFKETSCRSQAAWLS